MGLLEAFQDCGGPYPLEAEHTKTNYENFPTTPDELAVIRYLASVLPPDSGLRLLHIGLGNGEFFETLGKKLSSYTTVTISQPEIDRFCERHPDAANTRVLLANKHDPSNYSEMSGPYDLIVDVNIKSFACCQRHFEAYFDFVVQALAPGGKFLTAQSGLNFGWHGVTRRGYTPGMDADPDYAPLRVLGVEGLKTLASKYQLACESITVQTLTQGAETDETVWLLIKMN